MKYVPQRRRQRRPSLEKLLEQIVANSAALCEADLKLKATNLEQKAASLEKQIAKQKATLLLVLLLTSCLAIIFFIVLLSPPRP